MAQSVLQRLKSIHTELIVEISNPASRAARAMSLLKLLEDSDLLFRLGDVINDIEYYKALPDSNDPRLEKYNQILSIVLSDCQPRG
jgi:hypothetical protein